MIKKLAVLLLFVGMGMSGTLVQAAEPVQSDVRTIKTPYNQKGEQAHPWYSGAQYKRIAATGELWVSSGPSVLLGVYLTTGAATEYAIIRDTDTQNGTGDVVFGRLARATTQQNMNNIIPFPVRFTKGITFELQSNNAGAEATVLYLKQY